jgi:ankyrin repeat protein
VQLLLEKGADVNAQGGNYGNALQAAASNGNEGIVRLFLEKGTEIKHTHLQFAVENGKKEAVQLLLEKEAEIFAEGELSSNLQIADEKG